MKKAEKHYLPAVQRRGPEQPGRFLLTGSANLATVPMIADSLAGRMATISLLPFAQSEIRSTPGRLLDRLFAGEEPTAALQDVGAVLLQCVRGLFFYTSSRAGQARRSARCG